MNELSLTEQPRDVPSRSFQGQNAGREGLQQRNPQPSQPWGEMAHAVFVLCFLRCLTDSPTQPSMVSQNPGWAQRSDFAFNQRQTKKGEILHRKCHQAVISTLQLCWRGEEIQRNRRPLYRLELEMRTPQLNFQIKSVFFSELSNQDFFQGRNSVRVPEAHHPLSPKVWPQHGKSLYFRNPRSIAAGDKDEKQFCA